jgi:hypothetical protein
MAKLVLSQDALKQLLEQAKAAGNESLVREIEAAIANAKPIRNPNAVEDWDDAREAFQAGNLTIKKEAIRDAARLIFEIADANPELRKKALRLFSRAMRNGSDS